MIRQKILVLALLAGILMITGSALADAWTDLVNQGMQFARQGDADRAIVLFGEALQSDQLSIRNQAVTYSARGSAWWKKGDAAKAIADYSTAITIDPSYVHAYNNRAVVWQDKKEYDKAIADYTAAIALDPQHAVAYNNRGNVWKHKGEYEAAVDDYTRAIALNPAYVDALESRARIHFYRGRNQEAAADFTAILAIKPEDVYSHLWHHMALSRAGRGESSRLAVFHRGLSDTEWIKPVVRMFLEEISPEACVTEIGCYRANRDKQRACQTLFYAGEYYLLKNDPVRAKGMFLNCLATGMSQLTEYDGAQAELDRLSDPPVVIKQ